MSEIATRDTGGGAIAVGGASLDELERLLLSGDTPPEVLEDPDAISREIIEQILRAESDEELAAVGKATPWSELLGCPVELYDFGWRPSRFEEGSPIFLVVRGRRMDDGSFVVLTTSGRNVIATLLNLKRRGAMGEGCVWKLREADTPTSAGFRPLWLEKAAASS